MTLSGAREAKGRPSEIDHKQWLFIKWQAS